jgi:hypothetical protein
MPKVKLDIDDAEAILCLVDVLTGKRSASNQFVDRHDRTRLAPFYTVALENCQNALRDQRATAVAPKKARAERMLRFRFRATTRKPDGQLNRPYLHESQFEARRRQAVLR